MAALIPMLGLGAGATAGLATIATIGAPVMGILSAAQGVRDANQQSALYTAEGRDARIAAGLQAAQMRRTARIAQSAARTTMAEGGSLAGTGQGVLDQNAVARELDALTVEYQGEQQGRASDFKAQQSKGHILDVFGAAVRGFTAVDPMNVAPNGGA